MENKYRKMLIKNVDLGLLQNPMMIYFEIENVKKMIKK